MAGLIEHDLAQRLMRMVGFRNIMVREYHQSDIDIIENVLRDRLSDLLEFVTIVQTLTSEVG